jgi:uncharacterized protein (TIGR02677 family)
MAPPRRMLNQVAAFRHVTADNAPTYRAIMEVFFAARQRYVIELRAPDVLERLTGSGDAFELASEEALDYHLGHLVEWGNLAAAHDPGAVSRLEDFYKKRLLYHLTAVGEAAHRAVLEVEAAVGRSGSLQSNMLVKIRDALHALGDAAAAGALEPDALFRTFHDLGAAFDTLTAEANRFIGEIDRAGGGPVEEERFVLYKQALLAYIARFIEQLRRLADEIRGAIERVAADAQTLIAAASRSSDLPPGLGDGDPAAAWRDDQSARWRGVRAWFVGAPGAAATVERLAEVARGAVVALTRSLTRINDRRARPIDRAADFRALAGWFAACPDDRAAHVLWRAAFGLSPARHFDLAEADDELVAPGTSWWSAPPVEVPVRLRSHGRTSSSGRPSAAPDHTLTRQWIAQKRRREQAALDDAVRRFAGRGEIALSSLAALDAAGFDLLLALLDRALAAPRREGGSRSARTADGRLELSLRPPRDGARVSLSTPGGRLQCLDYRLEVEDRVARPLLRVQEGGGR